MEFTPEQKQAIKLHNCNILVSAAAGSGKTAVLSERIVQMVCREENPIDIDRILVVTFTNAAAAEMRERISQAILKRLNEDGSNENLQRQSALLHNAQITTIDSFCLFVLRNNFQDIGLDPAFRVADEGELELMKQDMLAELLEERFQAGEEDFYHCVEYFCPAGKESVLEQQILDLYGYAMSYPFPEDWLTERKQDYHLSSVEQLEQSGWGKYLLKHIQNTLESCLEQMNEVVSLCEQADGPYMYGEVVEKERDLIQKLCSLTSLTEMAVKLPAMEFSRLPGKKDDSVNANKKEKAKKIRDGIKDIINKMNVAYFSVPLETTIRQAADCEKAIGTLIDLCLEFKQKLDEKKRDKKLLDFSDMEHLALQVLLQKHEDGRIVATKTAQEYRDYFEEVLIDEYQDSNLVQEYLLKAVSKEENGNYNRFMVGDVKQSIYKFRLARPELFLEKYKNYSLQEGSKRRIDLHQNFRSRKEVVDSVNVVFSGIMTEKLGGIIYDDAAALYPGAEYPESEGCESELILFEKPDKESEYNVKQVEAMGIANRIRELKNSFQVTDKATGMLRPVKYRDMVILLRSGSGWDDEFKSVFEKEGIPAYVTGKTGYFSTKEIQDVLQFLRVLDNPMQDIALFGVMKSVFGGFTEEEVAMIKSASENQYENLYNCLEQAAKLEGTYETEERAISQVKSGRMEESLGKKCTLFLDQLARYRSYTSYMPILELLQKLMGEFHYMAYVSALPAGSKRLANVEMLLTKAATFEKNSYYGLYHFIRYMEKLEKYSVDYGEANTLDENADVVRIMSIHKSKGLEFPVAFVAGLSKRFNIQDTTQALIVDMDMGIGVDYVNSDMRIRNKTLRKNVLATKIKLENLAEEIRVLYVAMTRAREKLIMTATSQLTEDQLDELKMQKLCGTRSELTYGALAGASGYLDLLLPVFPNIICKSLDEMAMEDIRESVSQTGRLENLLQSESWTDSKSLEVLTRRFTYLYSHKNLEKLYTKTTVSELKKAAMEGALEEPAKELFTGQEITPYIPVFMREKEEVSGTTRGSAMHRVMELLDFTKKYDNIQELNEKIKAFQVQGRLSTEFAEAVRLDKIDTFLQSPLADRMRKAALQNKLYREQPFVYGISANRLSNAENEFPEEETVLIQGIVDAFFYEEDGIILLDYKTDVIQSPQELENRYKVQLDYYEEALTGLTGRPVKEKILYSFYLGCQIACE
ncbi:MAG TPA: helicase-exonuclease AddAB subunit AddA [Lachnospiraceae bacterium]|nr:helicase-exonuclease AddAB subunit AddA [Lachnospiraceae bacterium]